MKAKFYLALSFAALLMTNCSQDNVLNQNQKVETNTLNATIEGASRSTVSDGGLFSWDANDAIAVLGEDGRYTKFVSTGTEGAFKAETSIVPAGYAIYPYHEDYDTRTETADVPSVSLANVYTYGSTNAPMIAKIEEGATSLEFSHLAGLMRFKVKDIPQGVTKFTLTAKGKKIAGGFEPKENENGKLCIETSNTSEEMYEDNVTITFDAVEEVMDFYIPMPVGTYEELTVSIQGEGGEYTLSTTEINKVTRGKLLLMPTLACVGETLTVEKESVVALKSGDEMNLEVATEGDKVVVNLEEGAIATLNLVTSNIETLTLSDGSEEGTRSQESSAATLGVSSENHVSNLTIDAPTLTVNITSGTYGKVEALTAKETLIIGAGVEIGELVVKGGNVTLEGSLALQEPLVVTEDMTLDLGANTLTAEKTGVVLQNGTFTIKNGTLSAKNTGYDAISIQGGEYGTIVVNVEENATLEAGDCCIVVPNSNQSKDITINTEGVLQTESTGYAAISANGNSEGVKLNVTGGSITATMAGIYFPCTTVLNITDGEITGATAVYQKSGKLTISGGKLVGNGEKQDYAYNGNGCNETGDALVIEACNYPKGNPEVEITGGEFVSVNAQAIGSYVGNGVDASAGVTGFVKGGTFSDASAFEHLADGARVEVGADIILSEPIEVPADLNVTVDLNDFDITATNSDVFKVLGTLTLYGTDESVVTAAGDDVCAVWACGGTVNIYGGYYKVGADSEGNRNDCIYAGYNKDAQTTLGTIVIYDGKFEYTGPVSDENAKDGDLFLLNCADSDEDAHITVHGGTFKNHAPSYEPVGDNEVALGTDKKVYNANNEEVTTAHVGTTEIWYTVK